jgi:DNA-binding MarR family transcriptional regulator
VAITFDGILGAVRPAPAAVAGIAREMGITRQSVQRIADILVERGLAEYRDNPAHQRAKLLTATGAGRASVQRIGPAHRVAARKLAKRLGRDRFADILAGLRELSAALDVVEVA